RVPQAGQFAHPADQPPTAARARRGDGPGWWLPEPAGPAAQSRLAWGADRAGRDGDPHAARAPRAGRRLRRERTAGPRPEEVPPRRRAQRRSALRRLLAQRAVRRLRLHQRQPPRHRLRRLRGRRHRSDRGGRLRRPRGRPFGPAVAPRARRRAGTGARVTTNATAPSWLLEGQVGRCPCGCIGRRRRGSFVEKTISGASGFLQQAMFSDDVAAERGLLQRIEPRAKLLGLLGVLVAAALVRHIPVLLALYAGTLLVAAASRLSLSFFVKRVWLFIPVFTGIVVLPATFSFITHGHIVVPFGTWFGHRVGMTSQGLIAAGLTGNRVAVSISNVVLMTLTTPWNA